MEALVDEATARFLETGCGLLVGTALPDGSPMAARGWGCRVLEQGPDRIRLRVLLAADDPRGIEHARPGDRVAVTATSVLTLRSVQVKGELVAVDRAEPGDTAVAAAYCEAFFTDITATDGSPRSLLDRMRPSGYVAWTVEGRELFDQTPGPEAGRALGGSTR